MNSEEGNWTKRGEPALPSGCCEGARAAQSVGFGEIHAIGKLQTGNLAGVVLHFQVGLQNLDIDDLALCRAVALRPDIFQGEVAIMGFDEFTDTGVHGSADSVSHPGAGESCEHLN